MPIHGRLTDTSLNKNRAFACYYKIQEDQKGLSQVLRDKIKNNAGGSMTAKESDRSFFDVWESKQGELQAVFVKGGLLSPRERIPGYDQFKVRVAAKTSAEALSYFD
ncbi:hypothetical protein [Dongshaea marina]|uniref:hypothetical protein n=1 Tax=Dongshaea marina TaxID=2047966 RepID=UPI00131EF954|nr:hypothetical protein [Dongshaea marina]